MKRIAVLTTSGQQPLFIQSVYDDGILIFADPVRLPVARAPLMKEARELIPRLVRRGDTVLIDEHSGAIAKATAAKQVNLGMKDAFGVPVIVAAFNLYREMKRLRAIVPPSANPGAYDVPASLVNEKHSNAGETFYQVDWEQLRAEHFLTLMTVYATAYNDVGSAAYFRALMGAATPEVTPTSPLQKIAAHFQEKTSESIGAEGSLAGTKINENEWYL